MNDKITNKKGRGRPPKQETCNDRMTVQMPQEFKDIADSYRLPSETRSEFIRRCVMFTCAVIDVKNERRLLDMLDESERVDVSDMARAIKKIKQAAD